MSKVTTISHIRVLNELETQALEMAMARGPWLHFYPVTITIGEENNKPFVALHRRGNQELIIKFEVEHKHGQDEGDSTWSEEKGYGAKLP